MDVGSNNLWYISKRLESEMIKIYIKCFLFLFIIHFVLMFNYYRLLHKDVQILYLHKKSLAEIPSNISSVGSLSYYWITTYINIPIREVQRTFQKMGQKDHRSQKIKKFDVRLYLLVISEVMPIKSHEHECLNMDWTRTTPTDLPKWKLESPWVLNPTQRTAGN